MSIVETKCAIIDTKASGQYYLGIDDYRAMANDYNVNYRELVEGRELEFCSYVAGGFHRGMKKSLFKLYDQTKIPASGIRDRSCDESFRRRNR